jgi:hypothetical protein
MLNHLIGESQRGRLCMIIVIIHVKIEAIEQFIIILERMNLVKKEVQATPYKNIHQIFEDPLIMGGVLDRFVEGNRKLVTDLLTNS